MILIKKLTVVMCFILVTSCSSINSAKVGTLALEKGHLYNGQIISINKKQLNANFSERLSGSLIGHFIATGLGANRGLRFVSAIAGSSIADKEYGKFVDLIEVQSVEGQSYKAYVPLDYFSLNEQVNFIAEKTRIYSITRMMRNVE